MVQKNVLSIKFSQINQRMTWNNFFNMYHQNVCSRGLNIYSACLHLSGIHARTACKMKLQTGKFIFYRNLQITYSDSNRLLYY